MLVNTELSRIVYHHGLMVYAGEIKITGMRGQL